MKLMEEIIEDNAMSKSDILSYILDDFRVDPNKLEGVVLIDGKEKIKNLMNMVEKIPHHRYELYYTSDSARALQTL